MVIVTKKAHYQNKSNTEKTNYVGLEINSFVIYLNHVTFSIAVREQAKLHPNTKFSKANKNVKNVSTYVTTLTFGTNHKMSKLCCPVSNICLPYLLPFICRVSKDNLTHLLL